MIEAALREAAASGCATSADPEERRAADRAGVAAAGGSVLSAVLASACCWLPLFLILLGLSAGGVATWFENYRWPFLGFTAVLLGTGFYLVYFRQPACPPGSACAAPIRRLRRFSRVMIWVATVFAAAFGFFPNYVGYLFASDASQTVVDDANLTTITFRVDGMTCDGCAVVVRKALVGVPGVRDADVSYPAATATVHVGPNVVSGADALVAAVENAGFHARGNAETQKRRNAETND